MPRASVSVTQTGADTASSSTLETGIVVDGKVGWEIYAAEFYWVNGESCPAADYELQVGLMTDNAGLAFTNPDEVCRVGWAAQNTGGAAVIVTYEPIKRLVLLEPRVTVQPLVYLRVESAATGLSNNIQCNLYYNVVKLTDLEVLRLLQGGA